MMTHASQGGLMSSVSKKGLFLTNLAPKELPAETEFADFAAGCFWGVEAEFRKLPGVIATAVGYEGGHSKNPTYQEVCNHDTGHAETVRVEFDPRAISYKDLVKEFFSIHDPTTLNRQGPDEGDQYRSAIFIHNDEQKKVATELRDKLEASKQFPRKIVTEITKASEFTFAEDYHQQYVEKGGRAACHFKRPIEL
jgi:methionine-S-sulfoxide reductase